MPAPLKTPPQVQTDDQIAYSVITMLRQHPRCENQADVARALAEALGMVLAAGRCPESEIENVLGYARRFYHHCREVTKGNRS